MVLQSYIIYLKHSVDQRKLSQYEFRLALVRRLVTDSKATDQWSSANTSSDGRPLTQLLRYVLLVVTFCHSFHAPGRKTRKKEMCCVFIKEETERDGLLVQGLSSDFMCCSKFCRFSQSISIQYNYQWYWHWLTVSVTCLVSQTCLRFMCRIVAI